MCKFIIPIIIWFICGTVLVFANPNPSGRVGVNQPGGTPASQRSNPYPSSGRLGVGQPTSGEDPAITLLKNNLKRLRTHLLQSCELRKQSDGTYDLWFNSQKISDDEIDDQLAVLIALYNQIHGTSLTAAAWIALGMPL